jgi:hypothetical protein
MELLVWVILGGVALVAFVVGALVFASHRAQGAPSKGLDDLSKARREWDVGQYPPGRHSDLNKPRD